MFFRPIIEVLQKDFDVFITARDFSETISLLKMFNMDYIPVGRYGGRGKVGKVVSMFGRVKGFLNLFKGEKPHLAVSHNSYDQILASRLMGIRNITFMDYDKQPANHLAFRLSDIVVVQEWFPEDALRRFGAKRVIKYRGLKEELYLKDFKPNPEIPQKFNIKRPFVLARPPSTSSLYQRGYGVFWEVLKSLKSKGVDVRVLHRNPEDEGICKGLNLPLLSKPVDAPQLIFWADAFIGGGGTMTREAVILGTPAYSVLPMPGFLDKKLEDLGVLKFIRDVEDVKIDLKKEFKPRFFNPNILEDIVKIIKDALNRFYKGYL